MIALFLMAVLFYVVYRILRAVPSAVIVTVLLALAAFGAGCCCRHWR